MDYESVFQCLVLLAVMMDDNLLKQSITLQNCDYILVSGSLLIGEKVPKRQSPVTLQLLSIMHSFFYQSIKKQGGKLNPFFLQKSKKHTFAYNSLEFPAETNTTGIITSTTCIHFNTNYDCKGRLLINRLICTWFLAQYYFMTNKSIFADFLM